MNFGGTYQYQICLYVYLKSLLPTSSSKHLAHSWHGRLQRDEDNLENNPAKNKHPSTEHCLE